MIIFGIKALLTGIKIGPKVVHSTWSFFFIFFLSSNVIVLHAENKIFTPIDIEGKFITRGIANKYLPEFLRSNIVDSEIFYVFRRDSGMLIADSELSMFLVNDREDNLVSYVTPIDYLSLGEYFGRADRRTEGYSGNWLTNNTRATWPLILDDPGNNTIYIVSAWGKIIKANLGNHKIAFHGPFENKQVLQFIHDYITSNFKPNNKYQRRDLRLACSFKLSLNKIETENLLRVIGNDKQSMSCYWILQACMGNELYKDKIFQNIRYHELTHGGNSLNLWEELYYFPRRELVEITEKALYTDIKSNTPMRLVLTLEILDRMYSLWPPNADQCNKLAKFISNFREVDDMADVYNSGRKIITKRFE